MLTARQRRRIRQRANRAKKEQRISPINERRIFDPTPHNAAHIMRGEEDMIIYSRQHRPHYPPWHPEHWED